MEQEKVKFDAVDVIGIIFLIIIIIAVVKNNSEKSADGTQKDVPVDVTNYLHETKAPEGGWDVCHTEG